MTYRESTYCTIFFLFVMSNLRIDTFIDTNVFNKLHGSLFCYSNYYFGLFSLIKEPYTFIGGIYVNLKEPHAVSTNHFVSVFLQVLSLSVYLACITAAFGFLTWVSLVCVLLCLSVSKTLACTTAAYKMLTWVFRAHCFAMS